MNISKFIRPLSIAFLILASGQASAIMLSDRIEAPDALFLPDVGDPYNPTYFLGSGEDWSWLHNSFAVSESDIVSAVLDVRAFDVDPADPPNLPDKEVDEIWGEHDNGSLEYIGTLEGADDAFSNTVFNLGNQWFPEIVSGLTLHILIDQLPLPNGTGIWEVSLEYSELRINAKNPSAVPVPAAVWLFGTALVGLAGLSRRKSTA